MTDITSAQAKKQLDREWTMEGENPDYAGLHQGRDGTKLRHDNVMDLIRLHHLGGADRVVDFGCGTGLFMDRLAEVGFKPRRYVGIDFIEHRRHYVEKRGEQYGIPTEFVVGENIAAVPGDMFGAGSLIVCIGIMGYPGLHSLAKITETLRQFRAAFEHGVVTVPNQMPERLGEAEMARYASEDVQALLGSAFSFREIHTDTLVFW